MRMILVILAALIVAGGTGFYVMESLVPAAPEPVRADAPTPRPRVYAAARDVPIGTILNPDDLDTAAVDEASPEMIVADDAGRAALIGSVARQSLARGVPIARSAVIQPGDRSFLAAVLPRGKRAITIPIDVVGSLSGLALPGDRVDVILTYSIVSANQDQEPVRASETVLSNLRVLAFDQRVSPDAENLTDRIDGAPVAKTATLEVSPREAEVMTLAQTIGTLSLVLNSVRDDEDDAPESKLELTGGAPLERKRPTRLTLASDVTSTSRVQVVRGPKTVATVPSPSPAASPAPAPTVAQ